MAPRRLRDLSNDGRPPDGVPLRAPPHPGQFLHKNFLRPMGLTQTQAARLLGISRRRLHEIVQGQRAVTPDTAIRLALAFRSNVAFWLRLQSEHDSYHAWRARDAAAADADPASAYVDAFAPLHA
jgi:addiction module HigA family antidote